MSGRDGRRDGLSGYYILRGALVVVIIAAVLGVFGNTGAFKRPKLGLVNVLGLAVMALGLGVTVVATAMAKNARHADRAAACRLLGVFVCGIGAIMVICL